MRQRILQGLAPASTMRSFRPSSSLPSFARPCIPMMWRHMLRRRVEQHERGKTAGGERRRGKAAGQESEHQTGKELEPVEDLEGGERRGSRPDSRWDLMHAILPHARGPTLRMHLNACTQSDSLHMVPRMRSSSFKVTSDGHVNRASRAQKSPG
jgi:hypothetical protein